MGKVTGGVAMGFSGKVGDVIFSQHEGNETRVRSVPAPSTVPPTAKQLGNRQEIAVNSAFIRTVKDFVAIGFALEGKREKINGCNAATRYNRKNSFTGGYPERRIDFSKVLMTKGQMPAPAGAAVSRNEFGFIFTWDTADDERGVHYTDQVMLMAYFPELGKAEYLTSGSQRSRGTEILALGRIATGHIAEVYLSFIEDNRKSISDSVYLGQLSW